MHFSNVHVINEQENAGVTVRGLSDIKMRIRNSRSNFSQTTPPETTPRAAHLHSHQGSQGDRFPVEEENRRMGWSCFAIKQLPAQVAREDLLHDEMETESSTGIRPLNCVDKEKDAKHCMQINTNPASEGQSEGAADKRKEFSSCAGFPGGRESTTSAADIVLPYTFSQPGEKLPFKKRKPYNHTQTVVEMEIEEVEDVMPEVKVEDAIMEAKGKCVSVEVEAEDHLTEFKEEDAPVEVEAKEATVEMKEEDKLVKVEVEDAVLEEEDERAEVEECATEEVEEEVATMMVKVKDATVEEEDAKLEVEQDSMMVEVKVETTKMNELDDFNEDDLQKTQSINYTVTYGCGTYVPYLNFDENQQGHQKQEIGLEETEFEPNERPRRGRKRNRSGQSASSNMPLHFAGIMSANTSTRGKQKLKRGRPKRMQDYSVHGNHGGRQELNRGRPKRTQDHSVEGNQRAKRRRGRPKGSTPNNRDLEMPKPKRGRPKRVKDQPGNELM
ncbi:unnamed protein product [Prunus armeniaca]